jgi:predicted enzyme related to lactoylglutathione lyase
MTTNASAPPAAPALAFGRLVVLVRDYDEALAFYRAAFGARVLFDAPSPAGDRYLHLGLGDEWPGDEEPEAASPGVGFWLLRATGDDASRVGRQTGGQPLAVLYATDLAAAVARVAAAGGAVVRPVRAADGARFAHVADLYGNEFVLVELATGQRRA